MRSYREVFRSPGALRLMLAMVLARLSGTMLGVTLALGVLQVGGTVMDAGLTLTAHSACLAVFAPLGGRLADRRDPRRVMLAYLAANVFAYGVLLWLLVSGGSPQELIGAATFAGVTTPPSASVGRAHWPRIVTSERLPTAYALDTVSNSAMFVVGPPIAGVLAVVASPTAALVVATAGRLLGDLLLTTTPDLGTPREAKPSRRLSGAVLHGQVRVLLLIAALDTVCYGSLNIIALSQSSARDATVGVLIGALSAGEVLGGTAYGARRWPGNIRRQLLVLHLVAAAVALLMGAFETVALIGVLFFMWGLTSGVRDTINQTLIADAAAPGRRTETFAWLNTLMWGGYSLGTAAAGFVHTMSGSGALVACATGASVAAAAATMALRRYDCPRAADQVGVAAPMVSAKDRR